MPVFPKTCRLQQRPYFHNSAIKPVTYKEIHTFLFLTFYQKRKKIQRQNRPFIFRRTRCKLVIRSGCSSFYTLNKKRWICDVASGLLLHACTGNMIGISNDSIPLAGPVFPASRRRPGQDATAADIGIDSGGRPPGSVPPPAPWSGR